MSRKSYSQPFAKRSLGQNFLSDQTVVRRIVEAFDATEEDVVLEIGPGRGALTAELVDAAGKLIVLEFDDLLATALQQRFGDRENFSLVKGDALQVDFDSLSPDRPLRLISNLPYNISTAILQRLFEYTSRFQDCLLMFQREVVERIIARPGTKDRGYLTVLTEAHFTVERLFDVPPSAFRPAPKVYSSIVRLVPNVAPLADSPELRKLLAAAFNQKRKTIANNLKTVFPEALEGLKLAGIDSTRRAETLSLDEWLRVNSFLTRSL
jgi:16S rRNA (adenine1518-N6/adenine1519-N6)-dimethyltransferase